MTDIIVDFSEQAEREYLWQQMRRLRGKQRITIKRYREKRTDRQNRFYHPCFVAPFAEFLREQGENISNDDAHEMLKIKFLSVTVEDDKAGTLTYTRSTTDLDKAEFNDYLDRVAKWLNDMFGIEVPEPEVYHWKGK